MMRAYEASWTKCPAEPACVPVFNTRAVPIAAGVLHPASGLLLNPIIASLAMTLSSISVIGNAFREMAQAHVAGNANGSPKLYNPMAVEAGLASLTLQSLEGLACS